MHEPLLRARALSHSYSPGHRRGRRGATPRPRPSLDGVDLDIGAGETLGLVGRSGSGKSTLLRLLLALDTPDTGSVSCQGRAVRPAGASSLRWYRRLVQYVPQDPATSLDPRARALDLVLEPLLRLRVPGTTAQHRQRAGECLEAMGLRASLHHRRPAELSGGQAQRVAIARAIAPRPRLIIADEPVSGLDLPLRAQVVQVLAAASAETGLLLVSHDLSVVAGLCHRTLVMHEGRVVEDRPTAALLAGPQHPQTRLLIEAVPRLPQT